jgi:hypothetical protein
MGIAGVIAPLVFTQVFVAGLGRGLPGAPFFLAGLLLLAAMAIVRRELSSPPVPRSVRERENAAA